MVCSVLSFLTLVARCVTDEVGRGRNAMQRGGNNWEIEVRFIVAVRGRLMRQWWARRLFALANRVIALCCDAKDAIRYLPGVRTLKVPLFKG